MACKSILIVEDDLIIQRSLKEALEMDGHENVYTANNGMEALDLLNRVQIPCLILLDVMMPVMDGWEFLKRVKANHVENAIATIPIIVVSAARDAQSKAQELGAIDFVKKPVELTALYATVDKYCH